MVHLAGSNRVFTRPQFPKQHTVQRSAGCTAAKALISFSPPVMNQKVGTAFDVNVVLKDARNLSSLPLQILYDPQKLQLITVKRGGLFDRDGQAAALVQRVDSSTGRITASISRPSSAPGISGSGVVFTLSFMSKAPGRSRLRVDQTGLRDTSARAVSADSSEAVVTISDSATPPQPRPSALVATTPPKPVPRHRHPRHYLEALRPINLEPRSANASLTRRAAAYDCRKLA